MLLNEVFDFCLNKVFNTCMHQDAELISHVGGATKMAARLGYDLKKGGVQRVHNWTLRGIPAEVERDNPWISRVRRAIRRRLPSAAQEAVSSAAA